jgi:membrane associated rhomboid family serine protease
MGGIGIIGLSLIVANFFFSYQGFKSSVFLDKYVFEVDKILVNKDYKRLITSGFLHVSWTHLIFNMISLLLFSGSVEAYLGWLPFLVIYFASLLGGNLFALLIHKNNGDYSAVGASGAIAGVIFASIALFPGMSVGFFIFPVHIPGWLFGILYILFSIYGIKSKRDNIGHEAHLGGAFIGMLVALIMYPAAFTENYATILVITIPCILFIFLVIKKPHFLLIDNYFFKTHEGKLTVDQKYNIQKSINQKEVDRILDKISQKGMSGLNKREKEILKEYSKKK